MDVLFSTYKKDLIQVSEKAGKVRRKIGIIDSFIQKNTSNVCPYCKSVCCINKHGYYDYQDIIYIYAIGLNPPVYKRGNGCTFNR